MDESSSEPAPDGHRVPPSSEDVLTEAMLRALIEQVPLTTYIDRLDDISSNVYTSPQLEAVLGWTLQEWVEDDELFTKVVHPDDRDAVLAEHERTRETGEPFSMEYRMLGKDGSVHWFLDEANVIYDEDGHPQYHHGCLLEITERKALEEAVTQREAEIRGQKEELESLFEISPTGIVTVDRTGRISSWNLAAEELFGYTRAEAAGRPLHDLVSAPDGETATEGVAEGRVRQIGRRTGRHGVGVDVEVIAVPLREASSAGRLVLYHDVGELQRARQSAEEATRAKSAFLATMSHEIRTPMNAVIGMTELLLGTELTAEQREFADVVRTSGEALLAIINDILDFSKIEAGRMDLERTPFVVRDCVESALDLVAPRAADKNLDLACLIDDDVPVAVHGDPTRLRQILVNLLSNAVKFTESGEVVLHVTPGARADELCLAVRDTGIGIPADRVDRLFESFTQANASTTRRYGGTGLGLTISRRLAELMGGTITVDSRPGIGSTFTVSIRAEETAPPPDAARPAGQVSLAGLRLLIVDDNPTNREVVRRQAAAWRMVARDTGRPEEGLEWIRRGDPFDVAVLDMQMPGMDGIELASSIRTYRSPDQLPLIMLTSLGRRREDLAAGIDFAAYLTKPIKASQLHDAMVGVFGQKLAVPAAPADRAEHGVSALKILLAEDNAVNQRIAQLLLGKLGYRADTVDDGLAALQALRRERYDVVLMDVEMPEMDGLEASRRIHAEFHRDRPRIIAMTANAMEGDRAVCLAAGMDDYVAKPIRSEVLAAALARCVAGGAGPDGDQAELDPGALAQLREAAGDESVMAELTEAFLGELPGMVAEMRAALETGAADVVRRVAHTLKSNGRTFGATTLAERSAELEALARDGRLGADAAGLVAAIDEELGRVARSLQRLSVAP